MGEELGGGGGVSWRRYLGFMLHIASPRSLDRPFFSSVDLVIELKGSAVTRRAYLLSPLLITFSGAHAEDSKPARPSKRRCLGQSMIHCSIRHSTHYYRVRRLAFPLPCLSTNHTSRVAHPHPYANPPFKRKAKDLVAHRNRIRVRLGFSRFPIRESRELS